MVTANQYVGFSDYLLVKSISKKLTYINKVIKEYFCIQIDENQPIMSQEEFLKYKQ